MSNDTFYAAPHAEQMYCATPEEYLRDRFDGGVLDKALADAREGVVVVRYDRVKLPADYFAKEANWLLEAFESSMGAEFGGDDEDFDDIATVAYDRKPLVKELGELLHKHMHGKVRPWICLETSRRTYTRDEVEAILRGGR